MSTAMASVAMRYWKNGWRPIPLVAGDKRPIDNGWTKMDLTEETIPLAFAGNVGIGVLLGERSNNLIDVDLDNIMAVRLAAVFLPPTETVFGRPGKPRSHWLYRLKDGENITRITFVDPTKEKGSAGSMFAEIRGNGHQTMMPPSVHPSGEVIAWGDLRDGVIPASSDTDTESVAKAVGKVCAGVLVISLWPAPGSRHQFVLDLAGALLRSDWSYDEVEEFIITCAMQTGDLEIDDRRRAISDTAKKIVREEAVTGWPSLAERIGDDVTKILRLWLGIKSSKQSLPLTDEGNAQRLVRYFGQDIRYCPEFRTWLVWDSPVWRQDEAGGTGSAITGFSRATAAAIYDEIIKEPDPDKRQQIAKWAVQSGSGNRILMIPKLAKSEVSVQVRQSDLDSDPWKLNCTNGLLDLRTAGLQARSRGDFNTKVAGTHYDPSARCPGWLDHLHLIFNGKQDMITFVHRLFGYTLTGLIDEHIFPILYGQGSNGKSTLLEAIRGVLGGYAKNADSETFMAKQAEGIKTDIARLRGARFVTTVETGQGRRLAIPLVKQITGGDMVTARFLYSPEFEYRPTYKVWMATNHRPVISEDDEGIWRRIRLIPFNVQISVEQRVKDMDERLRAEWPGILAWAVEGCMAWQRHGLGTSEQIDIATATYREDSNNVGQFVDEMCFLEPAAQERSGILYRGYQGWCQGQGQRPVSSNVFKERMEALGPSCRRSSNGVVWTGIRMNLSPELMSSTSRSNPFGVN